MIALAKARLYAGLTLAELGDLAGMSWDIINYHERGKTIGYKPSTAKRLADALGLQMDELFALDEERRRWVDKDATP